MATFSLKPTVRWDANRLTRNLFLVGLPLATVVLLLCAVAAYVSGTDYETGYVVSQDGCAVTVAEYQGGPAALVVQGSKPMTGTCGTWGPGAEVYYDPDTHHQVAGPGSNVAATVMLGVLALVTAVLSGLAWASTIRKRRG